MLPRWLLAAGLIACVIGFVHARMWQVLPMYHCAELLGIGSVLFAIAWGSARLTRISLATALLLVWLLPLVFFGGVVSVLSTLLLALAATAIGGLFLATRRSYGGGDAADLSLAMLIGLALIAGVAGWLLPLPIFQRPLWIGVLLVVIACRWRAVIALLRALQTGWQSATSRTPRMSSVAMVGLGLASLPTWLPTMQFDDLAYHLGLPWQLQLNARYQLDPAQQVWALAPWSSDVLHGLVQLLAGRESRGALNALWLALSASFIWQLARNSGVSARLRWVAVTLYASLPMTAALLGGMQTENAGTAAVLALAWMVQRAGQLDRARLMLPIAVASAFLLALKASGIVFVLPLLLWLAWQWRRELPWRMLPLSLLLAVLVGGSSYVYAVIIAGNPVLPLFNGIFQSAYFDPVNFTDPRWHAGWNAALPWNLSLHTSRYAEGWDGAAGFNLVALAGALLLALWRLRTRAFALVAVLMFAAALTPLQYLRYAHPAMALMIPVMVAGARVALPASRVVALCLALAALDFAYQGNAHWTLRSGAVFDVLRAHGSDTRVLAVWAPERLIAAAARARLPAGARILATNIEHPFVAELAGNGRTISWYDQALASQARPAELDVSGAQWLALFRRNAISAVMLNGNSATVGLRAGLQRAGASRMASEGEVELWLLPAAEAVPTVEPPRAN
ncbi:MAG: hypothetical protein ABIQ97_04060 [Lysobacteraceae bacterium]